MLKERISDDLYVIGSLNRMWANSRLISTEQLAALPRRHGKLWLFKRCFIRGVVFHSESYKRVVARNDYTVEFQDLKHNTCYGSIQTFVKVQEKCLKLICSATKCFCKLSSRYLAIIGILNLDDNQLSRYRGHKLVTHIFKVKESDRYL